MRRVFTGLFAVSVLLLLGYGLVLLILEIWAPAELDNWCRPTPTIPFSKAEWDKHGFGAPLRCKMANDLLVSGRLMGRTEHEVKSLLGKPTWEHRTPTGIALNYDLVPQAAFPAGCSLLPKNLFFNTETWLLEVECAGGKVRRVIIRQT